MSYPMLSRFDYKFDASSGIDGGKWWTWGHGTRRRVDADDDTLVYYSAEAGDGSRRAGALAARRAPPMPLKSVRRPCTSTASTRTSPSAANPPLWRR